jgi:hypothetical protein
MAVHSIRLAVTLLVIPGLQIQTNRPEICGRRDRFSRERSNKVEVIGGIVGDSSIGFARREGLLGRPVASAPIVRLDPWPRLPARGIRRPTGAWVGLGSFGDSEEIGEQWRRRARGGAPASNRATLGPPHPPQRRRDPRPAAAAAARNRAERLVAGRDQTKGLPGMTLIEYQISRHAAPISPIRRKGQSLGLRSYPAMEPVMARADAPGSVLPPSSGPRRLSG